MTYFPIFQGLTHFANPKLEAALASAPVTVIADPAECSFQFNPVGVAKFTTSCDIAKSALVARSVNYAERGGSGGNEGEREGRRSGHSARPRRTSPSNSVTRSPSTAIRRAPNPAEINYVDDDPAADHPGDLRHHGVRADRRLAG